MWHTLLHSTFGRRFLEIFKSNKLGNKLEYQTDDLEETDKLYNKELLFTHYLSSKLENLIGKEWIYKDSLVIGISPDALKNNKWIMCDRMAVASCVENKFDIVSKSNKSKKVNFDLINDYINKRLAGFNNEVILKRYKYKNLAKLYSELNETFINDGKKEGSFNKKDILKKIEFFENACDTEIINSRGFKGKLDDHFQNSQFTNSHEIVFLEAIDLKYIKFIIINRNTINEKIYAKIKNILPPNIKVIEVYGIDKYNNRINKKISEVADKME